MTFLDILTAIAWVYLTGAVVIWILYGLLLANAWNTLTSEHRDRFAVWLLTGAIWPWFIVFAWRKVFGDDDRG